MKKLIIALLAAAVAISLTACKSNGSESPKNTANESSVPATTNMFENGVVRDENGIIGDEHYDKRDSENPVSNVVSGTGEAVENIGNDVGSTVDNVGNNVGSTIEDIGDNVGSTVEGIGRGAGSIIEDIGEGIGKTTEDIAQGTGSIIEDVGDSAKNMTGNNNSSEDNNR